MKLFTVANLALATSCVLAAVPNQATPLFFKHIGGVKGEEGFEYRTISLETLTQDTTLNHAKINVSLSGNESTPWIQGTAAISIVPKGKSVGEAEWIFENEMGTARPKLSVGDKVFLITGEGETEIDDIITFEYEKFVSDGLLGEKVVRDNRILNIAVYEICCEQNKEPVIKDNEFPPGAIVAQSKSLVLVPVNSQDEPEEYGAPTAEGRITLSRPGAEDMSVKLRIMSQALVANAELILEGNSLITIFQDGEFHDYFHSESSGQDSYVCEEFKVKANDRVALAIWDNHGNYTVPLISKRIHGALSGDKIDRGIIRKSKAAPTLKIKFFKVLYEDSQLDEKLAENDNGVDKQQSHVRERKSKVTLSEVRKSKLFPLERASYNVTEVASNNDEIAFNIKIVGNRAEINVSDNVLVKVNFIKEKEEIGYFNNHPLYNHKYFHSLNKSGFVDLEKGDEIIIVTGPPKARQGTLEIRGNSRAKYEGHVLDSFCNDGVNLLVLRVE